MREQLKTMVLSILVITSLLLSLGIWSTTPQYEAVDGPQYSSNVITDPIHKRTMADVAAPRSFILHLGNEKHTVLFPGQSGYEQGVNLLNEASFFELKVEGEFGEEDWWKVIGAGPSLEVDYGTDLPASILDGSGALKFTSRFDPTMQVKTLYLFKGHAADEDLRALFYASTDKKMYSARVVLPRARYTELFETLKDATPYKMFGQSLHRHFYLPEGRLKMPQYAVETTQPTQVKQFMETFFVDESLIRQVKVRDGSEILTDGIRLVERKDNIIQYSNIAPSKKPASKPDIDVSISRALSFANEHGGFTLQPVVLYEPPASQHQRIEGRTYQFRSYVSGVPVIDPQAGVTVQVIDNEVAKMQRSQLLIGAKPYQGKDQELLSGAELMEVVQNSVFDRNRITDAYLAYLLDASGNQDDAYAYLHPVWVVEQQGILGGGIFDAATGEELHDKEVLLNGLE